jgi:hypothetical protein
MGPTRIYLFVAAAAASLPFFFFLPAPKLGVGGVWVGWAMTPTRKLARRFRSSFVPSDGTPARKVVAQSDAQNVDTYL